MKPSTEQDAALQRARDLLAQRRSAKTQGDRVVPTLAIGVLLLIALILSASFREPRPSADKVAEPLCEMNDAQCAGERLSREIQKPCSRALESQLALPARWSDSALERRFANPTWYQPARSLIFYGNRATVTNALGMELTPRYFCVTTTSGGVVKAEFVDLQ